MIIILINLSRNVLAMNNMLYGGVSTVTLTISNPYLTTVQTNTINN